MFKFIGQLVRETVDLADAGIDTITEGAKDLATAISEIPQDLVDGYEEGFSVEEPKTPLVEEETGNETPEVEEETTSIFADQE